MNGIFVNQKADGIDFPISTAFLLYQLKPSHTLHMRRIKYIISFGVPYTTIVHSSAKKINPNALFLF